MVATFFQIQNSRVFQDFQGYRKLFSRIWSIQIPGYSRTEIKFCLIFKNIQGSHIVLSLMNLTDWHNRCRPHFWICLRKYVNKQYKTHHHQQLVTCSWQRIWRPPQPNLTHPWGNEIKNWVAYRKKMCIWESDQRMIVEK